MHIDFFDETNSVPEQYIDLLQQLLTFAAKQEDIAEEAEMSVSFVDNEAIRELNRNYRQKDEPTDVISFAMQDSMEEELEIHGADIPPVLGDVIISVDKAKTQAEEYGHSLEREISFLAVHGFLHLLGYDHQTERAEKEMFAKQTEILSRFGIER